MSHDMPSLVTSTYSERLKSSTYLSIRHKYLYVDTPKAACTTLKQLIADIEGISEKSFWESLALDSKIPMLIHDRFLFDLPSLGSVSRQVAEEVLTSRDFFRFCFVRNPYSRLFSAWQSKILMREPHFLVHFRDNRLSEFSNADTWGTIRQSFRRFVRYLFETDFPHFSDAHWAKQSSLIFSGKINYNLVGRTESFANDIRTFFEHLMRHGVAIDRLAPRNSNPSIFHDWRWFYDPDTTALVQLMYEDDFHEFGFNRQIDGSTHAEPLPRDATDPRVRLWIEEIVARNEMIVSLRSRLIERINEAAELKRQLATLESKVGSRRK
jgi:hypothetical protein